MKTVFRGLASTLLVLCAAGSAAGAAENYLAIAQVAGPKGRLDTPILISLSRLTTADERTKLAEAIRLGGSQSAKSVLEASPDLGTIEIEDRRSVVKFAYSNSVGDESILTVVTAAPIAYLGHDLPESKAVPGYDLAIATLYLDAAGRGKGELSPAAKIRVRGDGMVSVLDYAGKLVLLKSIERKPE